MAFVCLRCRTRLLQGSLKPIRSYATGATGAGEANIASEQTKRKRVPPKTRADKQSSPAQKQTLKPLNPSVWTSLLNTKRLGQDSSVIVFRDSEGNYIPRQATTGQGTEHGEDLTKTTAEELIGIVKESREAPGQDEVNVRVEQLKPNILYHDVDGNAIVSRKEFNHARDSMYAEFNALQLSRYITIQAGADLVSQRQQAADPSAATSAGIPRKTVKTKLRVVKSPWQQDNVQTGHRRGSVNTLQKRAPRSERPRGKMVPIQAILSGVWKLQVEEDLEGHGSCSLRLDKDIVGLLLVGGMCSVPPSN